MVKIAQTLSEQISLIKKCAFEAILDIFDKHGLSISNTDDEIDILLNDSFDEVTVDEIILRGSIFVKYNYYGVDHTVSFMGLSVDNQIRILKKLEEKFA